MIGALKKIKNGYLGGARVIMKNISEFFRTTSVSKLEFRNIDITDLLSDEISSLPRSLPTDKETKGSSKTLLKRYESIKERYSKQFSTIQKASMRHRSIAMDSNDADLAQLRLKYAQTKDADSNRASPILELPVSEKVIIDIKTLNVNFSRARPTLIYILSQIRVLHQV